MEQEAKEQLREYERPGRGMLPIGNLWSLPKKPQIVIEFEALSEKGRAEVRKSAEFKEIKKYYDQCHEVWQHNVAEHAWRMRIGAEPIGKVEYLPGTYVFPIHESSPIELHWIKDPEKDFFHKPNCPYATSSWDENKKIICCKREHKKVKK